METKQIIKCGPEYLGTNLLKGKGVLQNELLVSSTWDNHYYKFKYQYCETSLRDENNNEIDLFEFKLDDFYCVGLVENLFTTDLTISYAPGSIFDFIDRNNNLVDIDEICNTSLNDLIYILDVVRLDL
ncbi:hypothetical protein HXX01_03465 [Candidatus Nomurabacteria bacterium]|nr:hypothetical protein [Candidatus Nomurabacteria bacterium]